MVLHRVKGGENLPVRVENNNRISRLQIQTQSSGPRTQDKDHDLGVFSVERGYVSRALFGLGAAVEAQVFPGHHLEEVFHDIHHFRHLEEDEDAVACREELGPANATRVNLNESKRRRKGEGHTECAKATPTSRSS